MTTRKLVHLAAEHGFINPFAHRAMFDVLTMLMIFQRYDPAAALALAKEPVVTLKACVSYDDREKAKSRGYRWKDRQWLKAVRASEVEPERKDCGFTVVEITPLGAQAQKTGEQNVNSGTGNSQSGT
jgi:DNA polymerase-3 subunit epsilon